MTDGPRIKLSSPPSMTIVKDDKHLNTSSTELKNAKKNENIKNMRKEFLSILSEGFYALTYVIIPLMIAIFLFFKSENEIDKFLIDFTGLFISIAALIHEWVIYNLYNDNDNYSEKF